MEMAHAEKNGEYVPITYVDAWKKKRYTDICVKYHLPQKQMYTVSEINDIERQKRYNEEKKKLADFRASGVLVPGSYCKRCFKGRCFCEEGPLS